MSILVKGGKIPPSCRYCAFRHMSMTQNAFCTATHETIDYMEERIKRLDNCPLIEIPDCKQLIDRDRLVDLVYERISDLNYKADAFDILKIIQDMSAIIEVEEGEE